MKLFYNVLKLIKTLDNRNPWRNYKGGGDELSFGIPLRTFSIFSFPPPLTWLQHDVTWYMARAYCIF